MTQEYVMIGIMLLEDDSNIVKVLAKGSLDYCRDMVVEDEMSYIEFKIYTVEDFAEMADHVSIN